jgi:L-alanine-DL-glutamate epimerase-like enolase superfamily enzyme
VATALTINRVTRRFREPLQTAFGELHERETIELQLVSSDGVVGVGEAAPLEPYDGVALDRVEAALTAYAEAVAALDEGPEILATCQETENLPQALAAVDIARWDRAGKREGKPVAALLADDFSGSVPVNATIGALEPKRAKVAARQAVADGFSCVKVKVGVGDDAGRLKAVRAGGGPMLSIRIDANGAWTPEEAARRIPRLATSAAGLEIVEEPVSGLAAFRSLAAKTRGYRFAADESGLGVADITCLKISRSGGISALCAQAAHVEAFGGDVYLASTFDGPIGIAAAVHCAAALGVTLPCGLATLHAFEHDHESLPVSAGRIDVPTGPGLGL